MKKWWFGLLTGFICAVSACTTNLNWHTNTGSVWGTTYHITYQAEQDMADSILKTTGSINESLSMFSPTSTVARINAGITDSTDEHFRRVFDIALTVNAASDGRFDPTVAPLVDLWGFGRNGRVIDLPDSAAVRRELEKVGIGKCKIVDDRIIKGHEEMEFDFSGIAKGYGVDCVAEMFERNGITNYMVEIGGELRLAGKNPNGQNWRIQVDAPELGSAPGDSAQMILELTDCAIATSGNYRNYRTADDNSVIGHTIDPLTGFPADRTILSATVVASDCATADAIATALMASPAMSAPKIGARFPDTHIYIVGTDGVLNQLQ